VEVGLEMLCRGNRADLESRFRLGSRGIANKPSVLRLFARIRDILDPNNRWSTQSNPNSKCPLHPDKYTGQN
jgi:hypothetical protein